MKIRIKGKMWTVVFCKEVDEYDALGETRGHERLIKIQKGLSRDNFRETIAHELTHAYLFECGRYLNTAEEENIAYFVGRNFEELAKNFEFIDHYSKMIGVREDLIKSKRDI